MAVSTLTMKVTLKPYAKVVIIPFALLRLQVPTFIFKRLVVTEVQRNECS